MPVSRAARKGHSGERPPTRQSGELTRLRLPRLAPATPGTYEWKWGTGPDQNFTLDVVPEPSTWIMMLAGFAGLGFAAYQRFELTCGLIDLYIRIGSWEAYWNALRPFTIW